MQGGDRTRAIRVLCPKYPQLSIVYAKKQPSFFDSLPIGRIEKLMLWKWGGGGCFGEARRGLWANRPRREQTAIIERLSRTIAVRVAGPAGLIHSSMLPTLIMKGLS